MSKTKNEKFDSINSEVDKMSSPLTKTNYNLTQIKTFILLIGPIAFLAIIMRLGVYLENIQRPDLLAESTFSVSGLSVLLGVSIIIPLVMIAFIFLPSYSLIMMNDCFKKKPLSKCWVFFIISVPIMASLFICSYFYLKSRQKDSLDLNTLLLWCLISAVYLLIYTGVVFLFRKKAYKKRLNLINLTEMSKSKIDKKIKPTYLDEFNGWFMFIYLFGSMLIVGLFMLFTFIGLALILILPEENSLAILLIFVCSLFCCIPGVVYHLRPKAELSFLESIKWVLVPMTVILFMFVVILPTKFASTSLRQAGVYEREEQVFLLRTPDLANGLYAAKIVEKVNGGDDDFIKNLIFKAYKRYAFGNILWLCKHPFDPDAVIKKDSKEYKNINNGCIQIAKSDVTLLTIESNQSVMIDKSSSTK